MYKKNKMQIAGLTLCLALGIFTSYCGYKLKRAFKDITFDDLHLDFTNEDNIDPSHIQDLQVAQEEAKGKIKLRPKATHT